MNPGDIVFSVATVDDKLSTSIPRAFIRAGQWIKAKLFADDSPNVPVVHAAIAVSNTCVIESVGNGIQWTDLSTEPVKRAAMVYSCIDGELAYAASVAAEQFNSDASSAEISGRYSVWKAVLSTFKQTPFTSQLQARINESVAIGDISFCSQFVANTYEVGNLYNNANLIPTPASVFDTRPTAMTPWDLASFCDGDGKFYFAGFWQDGIEVRL